ncbi:MAG TPA: zinc ribbon domain-containing protein [Pyrinomonadaceae bacterium]|nr:zinc ribbon domain-containing protein [Pyrinomonadaceae bacterium]
MGILDTISSQFVEVIEWLDDSNKTLLYRFPVRGQEIKDGAKLTVRESQAAVFVFQGQIADVFHPGRTSMGIIGDSGRYTQFQAADAMREAAQNPSGGAGTGAGLGAGFALGNTMAATLRDAATRSQNDSMATSCRCSSCGLENVASARFCNDCGARLDGQPETISCLNCGVPTELGAKFCTECGAAQVKQICSKCQAEMAAGARFCKECGTRIEQFG